MGIRDEFIAGRTVWEQAGAQLVASVAPYKEAKIRVLNARHSALARGGGAGRPQWHARARFLPKRT